MENSSATTTTMLSTDKNRTVGQQATNAQQSKFELVEAEDSSNSISETSNYERRFSPSGQQLQLGAQHSLEPVKATKSVLFDTRSTTHAHNKKVQSGNQS